MRSKEGGISKKRIRFEIKVFGFSLRRGRVKHDQQWQMWGGLLAGWVVPWWRRVHYSQPWMMEVLDDNLKIEANF